MDDNAGNCDADNFAFFQEDSEPASSSAGKSDGSRPSPKRAFPSTLKQYSQGKGVSLTDEPGGDELLIKKTENGGEGFTLEQWVTYGFTRPSIQQQRKRKKQNIQWGEDGAGKRRKQQQQDSKRYYPELRKGARQDRVRKFRSMMTATEHNLLLQPNGATQHRELSKIWETEKKHFCTHEKTTSMQCAVCKMSFVKKPHIHHNHLWILPMVIDTLHEKQNTMLQDSSTATPMTPCSTVIRKHSAPSDPPSVSLVENLAIVGTIPQFPKCGVPPESPCHQISVLTSPYVNVGNPASTSSMSGVSNLVFPAQKTSSGGGSMVPDPPNGLIRSKVLRSLPEDREKTIWKKPVGVDITEDNVVKKYLLDHPGEIDIVTSPSSLGEIMSGGSNPIFLKLSVKEGSDTMYIGRPIRGGPQRPRELNTRYFKTALLSDGAVLSVTHDIATLPGFAGHKHTSTTQGETWDPDSSSEEGEGKPPTTVRPAENDSLYGCYTYNLYDIGGLKMLVRGKIDCSSNGTHAVVRAHMEYNTKTNILGTPDDRSYHSLEKLPENEILRIWAALKFRGGGALQCLLGRVNAFTSAVLDWETYTVSGIETQVNTGTHLQMLSDVLKSVRQTMQDTLSGGDHYLSLIGAAANIYAPSEKGTTIRELAKPKPPASSLDEADFNHSGYWYREPGQLPATFPVATRHNFPKLFRNSPDEPEACSQRYSSEGGAVVRV